MKTVEVVAAIIRQGDKIFATQRGYGPWKDWWEFPGGKVEAGETPQEALVREIREELEAAITIDEFLTTVEYDYPEFHLTMHCYMCSLAGTPAASGVSGVSGGPAVDTVSSVATPHLLEHEAARWLGAAELGSVRWLPADLSLLPLLAATLSGFPRRV